MKKRLFLGAILFGSLNVMHSQESCESALAVNEGTYMAPQITGVYNDSCWEFGESTTSGQPMKGLWYVYTAAVDGTLTVSTNHVENVAPEYSDDTKFTVFKNTCGALECLHTVDDNLMTGFFETLVFDVEADKSYYIHWDNANNDKGFKFSLDFEEDVVIPTATIPYHFNFETNPFAQGWTTEFTAGTNWFWDTGEFPAHQGVGKAVLIGSQDETNTWLFSNGVEMEAGQVVDIGYYLRAQIVGAGAPQSLRVSIGVGANADAQTEVLETIDNVINTTYQNHKSTFTCPADGIYYIGFNSIASGHVFDNRKNILIDTFSVIENTTTSTNDNELSGLKIFPNPATDLVTVAAPNALIGDIQITDINGRTVKAYDIANAEEATVSINGLSAGIYMVKISSDKGVVTRRIVKN